MFIRSKLVDGKRLYEVAESHRVNGNVRARIVVKLGTCSTVDEAIEAEQGFLVGHQAERRRLLDGSATGKILSDVNRRIADSQERIRFLSALPPMPIEALKSKPVVEPPPRPPTEQEREEERERTSRKPLDAMTDAEFEAYQERVFAESRATMESAYHDQRFGYWKDELGRLFRPIDSWSPAYMAFYVAKGRKELHRYWMHGGVFNLSLYRQDEVGWQAEHERQMRDLEDMIRRWKAGDSADPVECFRVLGVSPNATLDDLKSAYRKLAFEHHPDRGGKQEDFLRIKSAYDGAVYIVGRRASA